MAPTVPSRTPPAVRPVRKPLRYNTAGRPQPRQAGPGIQPQGLGPAPKPERPAGWKPKQTYAGPLALSFKPADEQAGRVPVTISVVMTHRPPKARYDHLEAAQVADRSAREVVFENVPAGDYLVICQPKGYRPFVRLIRFTRRTAQFELRSPLVAVDRPGDEDVLLREGERHPFMGNTRRFLTHFGYLRPGPDQLDAGCREEELCPHVGGALRDYQSAYGLVVTGTLTVETLKLMLRPRCAAPDVTPAGPIASSAGPTGVGAKDPIAFTGERWDSLGLRYRFFDGTSDINNEWPIIQGSLAIWASVTPLTFAQVNAGDSELEFDFKHPGDADYEFDEGGETRHNTYAWAWGPTNGTVDFDDHEDWGHLSLRGVAIHEIGHALGLDHSSVKKATMYAIYHDEQDSLHEIDVRGIKSLYPPVISMNGAPFMAFPLFALHAQKGTDTVTIDLGETRDFLAWGSVTMVDSLTEFDHDNMYFLDIFEIDGVRTGWNIAGGRTYGSDASPANVHEGAFVGHGRRVTFRLAAGHHEDLDVFGYAIVLALD